MVPRGQFARPPRAAAKHSRRAPRRERQPGLHGAAASRRRFGVLAATAGCGGRAAALKRDTPLHGTGFPRKKDRRLRRGTRAEDRRSRRHLEFIPPDLCRSPRRSRPGMRRSEPRCLIPAGVSGPAGGRTSQRARARSELQPCLRCSLLSSHECGDGRPRPQPHRQPRDCRREPERCNAPAPPRSFPACARGERRRTARVSSDAWPFVRSPTLSALEPCGRVAHERILALS